MFPEPTLVAVFLTGLLGGVHCAGMCGGIVGALALLDRAGTGPGGAPGGGEVVRSGARRPVNAVAVPLRFAPFGRAPGGGARTTVPSAGVPLAGAPFAGATRLLAYNAGRLSSYTLLGAAAGAIGSFGWLYGDALPLQQGAFAATNVLLVLMGLYVAGVTRVGHVLERIGSPLWRRLRPLAAASLTRASSGVGAFLAGALWGLVPCGMVYAVLAGALLSGGAGEGAALMLAFGLGTLPNLLLLGLSAGRLGRLVRRPRVRRAAGALIGAFGVVGLLRLEVAREIPLLRELCIHLPPFGA